MEYLVTVTRNRILFRIVNKCKHYLLILGQESKFPRHLLGHYIYDTASRIYNSRLAQWHNEATQSNHAFFLLQAKQQR